METFVIKKEQYKLLVLLLLVSIAIIPACGNLTTDEIVDAAGGDSAIVDAQQDGVEADLFADIPLDEETVLLIELLAETTSSGSIEGDFTADTAALFASSFINIPKSLIYQESISEEEVSTEEVLSEEEATTKPEEDAGDDEEILRHRGLTGDADQAFKGINKYIGLAEDTKSEAVDILVRVIPQLTTATLDEEFLLTEDAEYPDDPKRVLIEQGFLYNWKVSLFFTETETDPEMILQFTIADGGAAGTIYQSLQNRLNEAAALIYGETIPVRLAIPFYGVGSEKSIEILLHRDFSGLREWVNTNIVDPESTELDDLDLGAPDKVFINALLDGDSGIYTIHGASYHPGWGILRELGAEDVPVWGIDRNIYMFKAKATDSVDDSSLSDSTTVDDDSSVIDSTTVVEDDTTTDVAEVTGAKLYLAVPLDSTVDVTTLWEDDSIAVHFSAAMLAQLNSDIAVEDDGLDILQVVLDDNTITELRSVTEAEFEAFLDRDLSDSEDDASIQGGYLSVKASLNPAFYTDRDGFIGTYDDLNSAYWSYGDGLASSLDADFITTIDTLNAFDLADIVPYVPSEIIDRIITLE